MNQENKGVKSNEVCKLCLHQECLTCNQCHNINCFLFGEPLKSCFDALLPQSLEEKDECKPCCKFVPPRCINKNCICHIPSTDSNWEMSSNTNIEDLAEKEEWGAWKIVSDMLDKPDAIGIYRTSECYKKLYDFVCLQKEKTRIKTEEYMLKNHLSSLKSIIQSERKEVIGKHNAHILNQWQLKGLGDERVLFPILEKATEISLSSNKPSNE